MKHTKRCRGVEEYIRPILTVEDGAVWTRDIITHRCASCGTWLPLGPSDEAPVAVEVRAAEIAAQAIDRPGEVSALTSFYEDVGWWMRTLEQRGGIVVRIPTRPEEAAGYLAHAIAHHDDEQAVGQRLSDGGTTEGA